MHFRDGYGFPSDLSFCRMTVKVEMGMFYSDLFNANSRRLTWMALKVRMAMDLTPTLTQSIGDPQKPVTV